MAREMSCITLLSGYGCRLKKKKILALCNFNLQILYVDIRIEA